MPVNVTYNGTVYPIPVQGDPNWAPPLTRYLVALASGSLQLTGGAFTLLADVNFGSSYGLFAKYFTSITSNPSHTGVLRLADTDAIGWRNNANSADLLLTIDGTDQINFNGVPLANPAVLTQNHIYVGNASNQPGNVAMSGDATIVSAGTLTIANGAINNAKVNASAAIALSKLATVTAYDWITSTSGGVLQGTAVTPSSAVATDSNGLPTASATTATQLGYLSNVTSDVQAQINAATGASAPTGAILAFGGSSAPSGWLLCNGVAVSRTTYATLFGVIGTNYGSGDGSTTFNVPTSANNIPIGAGSIAALGATAGSATHTLTVAEIPAGLTVSDPGHTHALGNDIWNRTSGASSIQINVGSNEDLPTTSLVSNSATTGISVGGGGGAHSIVQPVFGVTYIIKT